MCFNSMFVAYIAEWTGKHEENEEGNIWEDNWDDDNVEDDFSEQLRKELKKSGFQAANGTEQKV